MFKDKMMTIPKVCKNRKLNSPWKSNRKNKKLQVCAKDKYTKRTVNVHFGDSRYEDFKQHRDKNRRKNFLIRTRYIKDKSGRYTFNNPGKANFWAREVLW